MKKLFVTCIIIVLGMSCAVFTGKNSVSKTTLERGSTVYIATCIGCHQAEGEGIPGLHPPLANTSYVLGDKINLVNIILLGMYDPVTIDNVNYTSVMPSFAQLTDQEIADVLSYVRNSFGNNATGIRASLVKDARQKITNQ